MRPLTLALAGALALGSGLAFAADLPPPPAPYLPPPPPPVEFGGGWYLRGDVGVGHAETGRWTQPPSDNGSTIISSGFITNKLEGYAFAGAGVGYALNNWFRADITGEYRVGGSAYGTYQEQTQYQVGYDTYGFLGQNNYKGSHDAVVGLVNAYVDLGTWNGLTPFIGAGVGFSYNMMRDFTDSGYAFVGYPNGPVYPVATNLIGDKDHVSLAYAAMAGVAYDVTPGLKLELGYRYLNLGEARSGKVFCATSCGGQVAEGFKAKDITSHDFRISMRWMLGGATVAPAPVFAPEPPLVRKG